MDPKAKRLFKAVLSPLTLAVGGAGVATFVVSGLGWVLPLTLGVAGVVSATQFGGKDDEPPLPEPYLGRQRALGQRALRIEVKFAEASGGVRETLAGMPRQLEQLRAKVARLLERQARIDAFVNEESPRAMQREVERLAESLAAARTQEAREKFAAALAHRKAELESRDGLRATSERISAELAELESALAGTLTKLVSLETLQGEEVREGSAGITGALEDVLQTAGALEHALGETFDPAGRRARQAGR